MVLVDRAWRGRQRKLLMHADRNGHFYVLDRTSGAFLAGTPFIHQTWNKGFDEKGRPMPIPGSNSSPEGSFLVYPTGGGGTNFQSPSYSPITGLFYLEYSEAGAQYVSAPQAPEKGREYLGRAPGRGPAPARTAKDPPPSAGIKAIDPETGKTVWDFKLFQGSLSNGVLADIWLTYEITPPGLGSALQFHVEGSKGIIEFDSYGAVRLGQDGGWKTVYEQPSFDPQDPYNPVRIQAYSDELADVLTAIAERRDPLMNGAEGRATIEMVEAGNRSIRSGRAVHLPLAD
jgi:hypothetical protein